MDHIERQRSIDANSPPADLTYEEVRQSFLFRLQRERSDLAALSLALKSAAPGTGSAYGNLERYAHRLRGAAAVFAYDEVRDCAKVLEFASKAALLENALADESRVQDAMCDLKVQLTRAIGDAQ
jgi:HPt (histidine-containing phosphotransfer) domain-containing protein